MSGARSEERAFAELAAGGLRGPEERAWTLVEESWSLISRRIAVFQRALRVSPTIWDDCGQEALLRVWRGRTRYAGTERAQLLAWIFRIVEREHLRLLERGGRDARGPRELASAERHDDEEPLLDLAMTSANPTVEAAQKSDSLRALEECLERLLDDRRRVVELLYSVDAPTEREVSAMLGIPKSQVHVLRKAGLEQLAICLGRGEDEG